MPDTAQGTARMNVTARRYSSAYQATKAFENIRRCAEQGLQDLELNRPAASSARAIAAKVQELLCILAVMGEQDRVTNLLIDRPAA